MVSFLGVALVLVASVSALLGGIFAIKGRRLIGIEIFYAFAAGTLLGISFFDLLPEAIQISENTGVPMQTLTLTTVVVFLAFHVLDRFIFFHARGEGHPEIAQEANRTLRASGLVLHSLLDGFAMGSAFTISQSLGIIVGLAIIFHRFSDGLNTVTVMLRSGSRGSEANGWLLTGAAAPLFGFAFSSLTEIPEYYLGFIMAFFIGEFIYLSAADMLPEAHRVDSSMILVLATVLGVTLIFLTSTILAFYT